MWILPVDKYDTGEKESNPNCAEIGQGYVIGQHQRVGTDWLIAAFLSHSVSTGDGRVGVVAIEHHTGREVTLREMGGSVKHARDHMAEWLGNRAINQKVAGSIRGHAKWRCVPGQGTSPYLPRGGNVPVLTVSRSG